jgi:hypothetical protein
MLPVRLPRSRLPLSQGRGPLPQRASKTSARRRPAAVLADTYERAERACASGGRPTVRRPTSRFVAIVWPSQRTLLPLAAWPAPAAQPHRPRSPAPELTPWCALALLLHFCTSPAPAEYPPSPPVDLQQGVLQPSACVASSLPSQPEPDSRCLRCTVLFRGFFSGGSTISRVLLFPLLSALMTSEGHARPRKRPPACSPRLSPVLLFNYQCTGSRSFARSFAALVTGTKARTAVEPAAFVIRLAAHAATAAASLAHAAARGVL